MEATIIITVVYLFCAICRKITKHYSHDSGNWEIHECSVCGEKKSYKVR